jgi:beta-phosphoglucomutase
MHSVGIGSPQVLGAADMVVSGLDKMSLEKLKELETKPVTERNA